ncbi:unnamed protein product [Parnassius apollo]|uniref:(apollo) hypothetical protein n=1 Tax=Parnassius apollo TaxID=110799 RepID=A0A8S3WUK8_PARAO|nr:unnamed protein product [Parnassius apollo]
MSFSPKVQIAKNVSYQQDRSASEESRPYVDPAYPASDNITRRVRSTPHLYPAWKTLLHNVRHENERRAPDWRKAFKK